MEYAVYVNEDRVNAFCVELYRRERSMGTIASYRHSLLNLNRFLPDGELTREALLEWKTEITRCRAVRTVNCMTAAVNAFLEYVGAVDWKLKALKCQSKVFSEDELSKEEFSALVQQAEEEQDIQTAMLLRAMAGTGVRVSEVRFLTVEAVRQKTAVIRLKGKTREISLGDKLCRQLLQFASENQRDHRTILDRLNWCLSAKKPPVKGGFRVTRT